MSLLYKNKFILKLDFLILYLRIILISIHTIIIKLSFIDFYKKLSSKASVRQVNFKEI